MNDDGNPSARPSTRSEDGRKERKKERDKVVEYGTIVKGSGNQKGKEEGERGRQDRAIIHN